MLTLRDGQWRMLSGGGVGVDHDAGPLADWSQQISDDLIRPWKTLPGVDPHLVAGGGGAGGVHDAEGGRGLFPWYGHALITWAGRNSPRIGIRGPGEQLLATTGVNGHRMSR